MPTVKSFSDIGEKYEKNKKKNCFPIGGNNGFDPAGNPVGLGQPCDTASGSHRFRFSV